MKQLILFIAVCCFSVSCATVKNNAEKSESDDTEKEAGYWIHVADTANDGVFFGQLTDVSSDLTLTADITEDSQTVRLSVRNRLGKTRYLGLYTLRYYNVEVAVRTPDNRNISLIHPKANFVLNSLYRMHEFPSEKKLVVFSENLSDITGSFHQEGNYSLVFKLWYYEKTVNESGQDAVIRVQTESDPITVMLLSGSDC